MAAIVVVSVLVLLCAAAPATVGGITVLTPNAVYLKSAGGDSYFGSSNPNALIEDPKTDCALCGMLSEKLAKRGIAGKAAAILSSANDLCAEFAPIPGVSYCVEFIQRSIDDLVSGQCDTLCKQDSRRATCTKSSDCLISQYCPVSGSCYACWLCAYGTSYPSYKTVDACNCTTGIITGNWVQPSYVVNNITVPLYWTSTNAGSYVRLSLRFAGQATSALTFGDIPNTGSYVVTMPYFSASYPFQFVLQSLTDAFLSGTIPQSSNLTMGPALIVTRMLRFTSPTTTTFVRAGDTLTITWTTIGYNASEQVAFHLLRTGSTSILYERIVVTGALAGTANYTIPVFLSPASILSQPHL